MFLNYDFFGHHQGFDPKVDAWEAIGPLQLWICLTFHSYFSIFFSVGAVYVLSAADERVAFLTLRP